MIEPKLRQLRLEIGLDCALLCRHCSVMAAPGNQRVLPRQVSHDLINSFAAMGGEELTITGGEPILAFPETLGLLDQGRALGLKTVVFTSGVQRVRNGIAPLTIAEASILATRLDRIVFSLYSAQPDRHDLITKVPGSHAVTVSAISSAVQVGLRTEIHFVPMRQPGLELRQLYELGQRMQVSAIRVIRFVPHGRARVGAELRPTATDLADLRDTIDELPESAVAIKVGPAFRFLVDDAPYCTAAIREIVIGSDGSIYPCSGFLGYQGPEAIGNVFDGRLEDLWATAPFLQSMRRLVNARIQGQSRHPIGCPAQKAFRAGHISDDIPDPDTVEAVSSSRGVEFDS
jgi:MoaA/NifB/PqqE/SkfB family radical SAM enzyme